MPRELYAPRRFFFAVLGAATLTAACSGGATSVSGTSPTSSTTTTIAATTTTPTTTTIPPTTTTTPSATAQLTGLTVAAEIERPAIVAKIDNHRDSIPQWGLNQADIVFEELVEGAITRFAAVFHSKGVGRIGPIRSARTGDFELLRNLNKPLFVNSGANEMVWQLLRREDAIVVSDRNIGKKAFSRTSDKSAPHNLITSTDLVYDARPGEGGTPPALFNYRPATEQLPGSIPAAGVDIDFGATEVTYRWNPTLDGYERSQNGSPHTDANGVRIAPQNVIIQYVRYGQSAASSITPEPRLIGRGDALILSQGRATSATWQRASSSATTAFLYLSGNEVELTPGTTWVAYARADTATLVS